jgi:hypothetical protein
MNQFLIIAAAEKIAAMETENFFADRRTRVDQDAFLSILNRKGGEPPSAEDTIASSVFLTSGGIQCPAKPLKVWTG